MKVLIVILDITLGLLLLILAGMIYLSVLMPRDHLPGLMCELLAMGYLTIGIISNLFLWYKRRSFIDRTFIILSGIYITLFFLPFLLAITGIIFFGGNWDL
jgi:hypothetical protein